MRDLLLPAGIEMRRWRAGDAAALFAAVEQDRTRLARWMPWVPYSTAEGAFGSFITDAVRAEDQGTAFHRGLFDGGRVVGGCGTSVDLVNLEADVGYWLAASHEGRGIVTAAVSAFLDFLFADYEVHRVVIRAAVDNIRSRAVAERLGFTAEGILRESLMLDDVPTDAAVYSMLDREWAARSRQAGQ